VLTDHLVCTDTGHLSTPGFVTIPGIEIHGHDKAIHRTPHVVGIGTGIEGRVEQGASLKGLIDQVNQNDGLAVVAHPYWSALRDEHLSALEGYVGIEIYSYACWRRFGKGDSLTYWDNLLYDSRPVRGLGVGDAHCLPENLDIGGGWIVVKAPELTETAILEAIRGGHFYASQGPAIEEWGIDEADVYVRCSPVERIQIHGPNGSGRAAYAPKGRTIIEATSALSEMPRYLRATCVGLHYERAWTNPVFIAEPSQ